MTYFFGIITYKYLEQHTYKDLHVIQNLNRRRVVVKSINSLVRSQFTLYWVDDNIILYSMVNSTHGHGDLLFYFYKCNTKNPE